MSRSRIALTRRGFLAGGTGLVAGGLAGGTMLGAFATARPGSAANPSKVGEGNELDRPREMTGRSLASIDKGNRWLLKAINRDGGAGLDLNTPSDVACTSVVGLAFLSQGMTPVEGQYSRQQDGISDFLLKSVEKMGGNGQLQNMTSQIEGDLGPYATHFFSMIFLAQVMGEAPFVERFRSALLRLEGHISGGQLQDGSWGSNAWAPLLATACGWLSLRAANFAGIKVSGSSQKAGDYLINNMSGLGQNWGSGSWYHRLYGTASGVRVLYALERDQEDRAKQALKDIMSLLRSNSQTFGAAGGEEYLTFHLMTEMLMQKGGKEWDEWYPLVRDKLISVQNRDGSWTGHHCITSRTFSTACAMMVLTAPNRYLPISQV